MSQGKLHRIYLAIGALVVLCGMLLYGGCGPETEIAPPMTGQAQEAEVAPPMTGQAQETAGSSEFTGSVLYFGLSTLEEGVLLSDVMARVRLRSVVQTVEFMSIPSPSGEPGAPPYNEGYVGALEFTFEVLEYLKGSGGATITAVAYAYDVGDEVAYDTPEEAEALEGDLLVGRDTRWDDREAIVFAAKGRSFPSTKQADRYLLGALTVKNKDGYTVASNSARNWLPNAVAPTATPEAGSSGSAGSSVGDPQFLLEAPSSGGVGGAAAVQPATITLTEMKALIARLQAEVDAGDGSDEYLRCVKDKYSWQRRTEYDVRLKGNDFFDQYESSVASGLPAGTEVYVSFIYHNFLSEEERAEPDPGPDVVVISGRDSDLFVNKWPYKVAAVRPLPAGEYRFYYNSQGIIHALCDAMPLDVKRENEIILTVPPPPRTLHEAFFDPISLPSGVGVESYADTFTVFGSVSTSIASLKWHDGVVSLTLDPYFYIPGHTLYFIALDGSIVLSLSTDSATADADAATLAWPVEQQPWQPGDLLMLRIAVPTP